MLTPLGRTALVIFGLGIAALGWETVALVVGHGAFAFTISRVIWTASSLLLVPLAGGVLCGHFWGPMLMPLKLAALAFLMLGATTGLFVYAAQMIPAAFLTGYMAGSVFFARMRATDWRSRA